MIPPFARAPGIIMPIGQTSFISKVTKREEWLSVSLGVNAAQERCFVTGAPARCNAFADHCGDWRESHPIVKSVYSRSARLLVFGIVRVDLYIMHAPLRTTGTLTLVS